MKVNYQQVLGGLSTLLALSFCNAVNPAPVPVSPISVEALSSAPRDSLPYTLRWHPVARATGYRVTVTASAISGGVATSTGGLPLGAVTTDTTFSFTAVNLTYDSIAFTASVTATSGTRSGLPGTVSWSVVRSLGTPGPIQVDSSAIPPVAFIGLDVHANHIGYENFAWLPIKGAPIYQGGEVTPVTVCAYFRFSDGTVAEQSYHPQDCMYNYRVGYALGVRNVCTQQPPIWNPDGSVFQFDFDCTPLPNAKVQSWADAQCVDWSSSDTLSVTVQPALCPPSTSTQAFPVPGGTSALVTGVLRGYGHKASIKLGWG